MENKNACVEPLESLFSWDDSSLQNYYTKTLTLEENTRNKIIRIKNKILLLYLCGIKKHQINIIHIFESKLQTTHDCLSSGNIFNVNNFPNIFIAFSLLKQTKSFLPINK